MNNIKLPHNHGEKIDEYIIERLDNKDHFDLVAEIFKQLGDSNRIRLFWLLSNVEECVINISALIRMSSPAVSHHLRLLKTNGLVTTRRLGKEVYYKAADTKEAEYLKKIIEKTLNFTDIEE